jgi:hypothetical protein
VQREINRSSFYHDPIDDGHAILMAWMNYMHSSISSLYIGVLEFMLFFFFPYLEVHAIEIYLEFKCYKECFLGFIHLTLRLSIFLTNLWSFSLVILGALT